LNWLVPVFISFPPEILLPSNIGKSAEKLQPYQFWYNTELWVSYIKAPSMIPQFCPSLSQRHKGKIGLFSFVLRGLGGLVRIFFLRQLLDREIFGEPLYKGLYL